MGISHWNIVLGVVGLMLIAVLMFNTGYTQEQQSANQDLAISLSTSMKDAAATSEWDTGSEGGRLQLFANMENLLASQLNVPEGDMSNDLMTRIPVIALADYRGYYLYYTDIVKDDQGYDTYVKTMSPLLPYEETLSNGYKVAYGLDGYVSVTKPHETLPTYRGDSEKVYSELPDSLRAPLSMMARRGKGQTSEDTYEAHMGHVIATEIETAMETLVQTKNLGPNKGTQYRFSLPAAGAGQIRSITKPTIIALYQGKKENNIRTLGGDINIYSFAAAGIAVREKYQICGYLVDSGMNDGGNSYYHRDGCPYADYANATFKGTSTQCAAHGAKPCPYCIITHRQSGQ